MYRKKEDLSRLVSSLTKGEKRHFTNFYRQEPGAAPPWFLQLYEMYENGKSQIPKEIFDSSPRALVSAKRLLYDNILKSLRSLHEGISIDVTLQNMLTDIELLFNHNLPDQASLVLNKAYGLAVEFEKFGHLLQLLEWEKRLNIVLDEISRPTAEIIGEENSILLKSSQLKALESLYSQIMIFKRTYGYIKGKLKDKITAEIITSGLLPEESSCRSTKALYYRNSILSIYYWMVSEPQKAFRCSKKLLMEKGHGILPGDYILGLFQHITSAVCLGLFDETVYGLRIAESYYREHHLEQSAKLRSLMFVYRSTYEIKAFLFKGDLRSLKRAAASVKKELQLYEGILPADHLQIVTGNLMNCYMAIGNWKESDRLWNELMAMPARTVRKDILADLYLFRIFNLIGSRYYDQVAPASTRAIRFYLKEDNTGAQSGPDLAIAQLLQKEGCFSTDESLVRTMTKVKQHLSKYILEQVGQTRFHEHYSRYEIWCEAIIKQQPFHKAAARWHHTFNLPADRAF